ncbi:hypothetical protein N341_04073, partial [Tyto alba]
WVRDRKKLLQIKDKKVTYYVRKEQCRCKVFMNGSLQIEQVVKQDSGQYRVTVYHQDGKLHTEEETEFIVQGFRKQKHHRHACPFSSFSEPVPQPILNAECINKTISVKCEARQ